jgi:hypothetical protein
LSESRKLSEWINELKRNGRHETRGNKLTKGIRFMYSYNVKP